MRNQGEKLDHRLSRGKDVYQKSEMLTVVQYKTTFLRLPNFILQHYFFSLYHFEKLQKYIASSDYIMVLKSRDEGASKVQPS